MNRLTVEIRMELCGDPVFHQWCESCALPSMVEQVVLVRMGNQPARVATIRYCTNTERTVVD